MGVTIARSNWPAPVGRLVDAGGNSFYVIEVGTGPAVLFLHGGGPGCHGWSDFGPVVPGFARHRKCVVIDLLQYGQSDKPVILGPVWDFHAKKILALLDAMGLGGIDLVCNSWGGSAGLRLASLAPERVRTITVTGSMPVLHGALTPLRGSGRGAAGTALGGRARAWYYGGEGPSREKMRKLIGKLEWYKSELVPDATVSARYKASIEPEERRLSAEPRERGEQQDLADVIVQLVMPVLFLWGMHDPFMPLDYPLMLANLAPVGQFATIAKAAHHPQEERPRTYTGLVEAFLDTEGEPYPLTISTDREAGADA